MFKYLFHLSYLLLWISLGCNHPKTMLGSETPMIAHSVTPKLDQQLGNYAIKNELKNTEARIRFVGSDSMDPVVQLWCAHFTQLYPSVQFEVISRGSGTAVKALLEGSADIGHMSRAMTESEQSAFESKFGYPPTRIAVAVDALAIYVNANNAIPHLRMEEIDAIFSKDRKSGHAPIQQWGDLGLKREWESRAIHPYGRNPQSGTRAFFKEAVLLKGEYRDQVKEVPDQFALVEAPAVDPAGISYGPIQHYVRMVRPVPIIDFKGQIPMVPTLENIVSGKYPLTRFLYLYINQAPNKPLNPMLKEMLGFVLSKDGQKKVADFGAIPLPADMAQMSLQKLK